MTELLVSVAAFFVWIVFWAIAAGLLTALTVVGAALIERYFVISDKWTYPLWILALSLSPAAAFALNWTLWGMVASERSYNAVRFGCIGAGILFAVVAIIVVARKGDDEDKGSEIATLVGALLVDALCCAAMIWRFGPIAEFMQGLGS